ncbi:hypothetical protein EXN24_18405 [Rhizobium rhizogenes]|uniref:Uncharacterized protein n=1 Tax=Rhizobium rhizogenes TaxID=359 RepID=A0AA94VBA9_RHIRH|nr:HAD hydrolase-like protein [Agrobacterium tumefaciens]NSY93042.1 HAD hydrolase-like protein [Agrobacterium tumefaciens]TRA87340.1 hypothetical protein EXN24_18405 [Rhizobium rhizogenes]
MERDIAGASGAGLASCLVRTGILPAHPMLNRMELPLDMIFVPIS